MAFQAPYPLNTLLPSSPAGAYSPVLQDVYNVSNFGDSVMCYSHVQEGESYVLFLTDFEAALSAKYDDIFGAAAAYNAKNDAEVLAALGESLHLPIFVLQAFRNGHSALFVCVFGNVSCLKRTPFCPKFSRVFCCQKHFAFPISVSVTFAPYFHDNNCLQGSGSCCRSTLFFQRQTRLTRDKLVCGPFLVNDLMQRN